MNSLRQHLVIFALIFSTGVSSSSYQYRLTSPHRHGAKFLKIHNFNQSTGQCQASVSGQHSSDSGTELTMKERVTSKTRMDCFQTTYQGKTFALKVISPSEIVFEKLPQGTDCMNSNASIFKRISVVKLDPKAPTQLISQKHGLPANETYLAVPLDSSDSLFLTYESNRANRFKIRPPIKSY